MKYQGGPCSRAFVNSDAVIKRSDDRYVAHLIHVGEVHLFSKISSVTDSVIK